MSPSNQPPAKTPVAIATEIFAVVLGLFLGLAIWKFGNPVILDHVISPPTTWQNALAQSWPLHWANWLLAGLVFVGAILLLANPFRWPGSRWLWVLPLGWLAWQFLSAARSPYHDLTVPTLWQYAGCAAVYFLGALLIGSSRGWRWVLLGVLAGFAFCLMRAVDQKVFEFPSERQFLVDSEKMGWTNVPPAMLLELRKETIVVRTNGVDIANPTILAKYDKGRVQGTLIYANALAGVVLLLAPAAVVMVWQFTKKLRRLICFAAVGLIVLLSAAGLFWSGSKSGWLIALAMGVFWLCRLNWSQQLKWLLVITLLVGGLVVFGLRFQSYFARGATSVGARFDYWAVAARVLMDHPLLGTGPGTFQRPYAAMKRPESEMARLAHNDYLEQFSDSGWLGGLSYFTWVALLLGTLGRRVWKNGDWLAFGIFAGLLGWFLQGFIEFSLFIPALAWTAFTLAGCLLARLGNQVDKTREAA